jgi:hypothetical protein
MIYRCGELPYGLEYINNNNNDTMEESTEDEPTENGRFVEMREAMAVAGELLAKIAQMNAELEITCPICLEQYGKGTEPSVACHDEMHHVCIPCYDAIARKFKSCPICRKDIRVLTQPMTLTNE